MKINIRPIALLIALFALPTVVQAADKSGFADATERAALLKSASPSVTVTVISNHQKYRILPGVRAAESLSQEPPQQTISRHSGKKIVETKGSFVVFSTDPKSTVSVESANGGTTYPTALNSRTGGVGILTGTLTVKLNNMDNADAVAADHGLEVVRVFAHLQTAFFRVKPGQDVVAAVYSLTADPRVTSAEMEVIEHISVPQ